MTVDTTDVRSLRSSSNTRVLAAWFTYHGSMRVQPAGDFDYESNGQVYSLIRQPDPRIARRIRVAIGDASTLINVGAGAGSYEPTDVEVTPIEPSATMRAQRPSHLAPAIDAVAEELPFDDDSFDAALASMTVHQWRDLERGIGELRRVTRGPIVILTFDPAALEKFWLRDYAPAMMIHEARRMPKVETLAALLGANTQVDTVTITQDCVDGFAEAYFARPEAFLDERVRRSQSAWGFISEEERDASVARLRAALDDGSWDEKYGHLRTAEEYSGALRLIVGGAISNSSDLA